MANDMNNGAAKLKERILDAARTEASATAEQAKLECAEIEAKAERQMEQNEQQYAKQREEAVRAILERSRTNAELAARKEALSARREVIDRVFAEAYTALCGLSDSARGELYRRLLEQEAAPGETVLPGKADGALVEKIAKEAGKSLTVAEETAQADYGFLLKGAAFEKDCTFEALLRDARAEHETGVAKILFE